MAGRAGIKWGPTPPIRDSNLLNKNQIEKDFQKYRSKRADNRINYFNK